MKSAYQVILAEDHVRFRGEIKKIINSIPGVEVRGETGDGVELFDLLEKSQPDLVILDISMPNLRAMKATREIKLKHPSVKVIIMAMDNENEYRLQAIAAGAEGLVLKQESAMNLEPAVQQIRQGKNYFPKISIDKKAGRDTFAGGLINRLISMSIC